MPSTYQYKQELSDEEVEELKNNGNYTLILLIDEYNNRDEEETYE